jgi:uncharacterized protein
VEVGPPPEAGVRWHTREDSGLRLDRTGRWWHDGEPIEHPRIVEAFNRGLTVTPEGRYRLEFGGDWCFVEVEDCGYTVLAVEAAEGGLALRLSDRTAEWLEPRTLALDAEGVLTCRVKAGLARARLSRPAHLAVASALELEGPGVVLRVGAVTLPTELPAAALRGE